MDLIGCIGGQCCATHRADNMNKLLLILGLVSAATAWPYTEDIPNYVKTPLGESIDKSTMKLLKVHFDVADDKNVVSSPLGLMMLLSLFNSGAGPQTKEEITRFLGGTAFKQTSDSYRDLSEDFSQISPEGLTIANKVYVSNNFSLRESFIVAARSYRSEVDTIDFSQPAAAAAIINNWADEKTMGNIKDPVSEDSLSQDTAAALFNVIYFKGHWHVPFKSKDTKDKDFHTSKGTVVKKPTMHLFQSLYYAESPELGARMVELPYKEKGFRMVVVLPNEVDGLPSVLEKASEKGLLTDVFNLNPTGTYVDLDIPKFNIKTKLDLKDILPKVGVSKLFDESTIGMVHDRSVKVSKAFQEAFIKVDEEGATAGAFTGVVNTLISTDAERLPPKIFTVDHPFLYIILYEDKILFAGTYTQ